MKPREKKKVEDKKEEKKLENSKKNKFFYGVHWIVIILCVLVVLFEIMLMLYSHFADESTLNIFGNRPYIATYDDNMLGIKRGDLVVGKDFVREDYNNFTELIYKASHKKKEAIIVKKGLFGVISKNEKNIESKIVEIRKKSGSVFLYMRDVPVILLTSLIVICIYATMIGIRDDRLSKKHLRARRLKDTCVLMFIITTYITTFCIGKLIPYKFINDVLGEEDIKTEDPNNPNNPDNPPKPPVNIPADNTVYFIVTEDGTSWDQLKTLNIFETEQLHYVHKENKIAPGSEGIYEFKVENRSSGDMEYAIECTETNEYDINLMYKIKRNGEYVNSEYMYMKDIEKGNFKISVNATDTVIFEWKWIDADNDTYLGKNSDIVNYNINVKIIATANWE